MRRLSYFTSSLALLAGVGVLPGCLAPGSTGECDTDEDCRARGAVGCDVMQSKCIIDDTVPDSTGDQSGTFSSMPIPFYRGQLCTSMEVKAGSPIPMYLNPCLHDCLEVNSYRHQNFYECVGGTCEMFVIQWGVATGTDCPENVFGNFGADRCDYTIFPEDGKHISSQPVIRDDDSPIVGTMLIEVPFLSNADIKDIADDPNDRDQIKEKMHQYVRKPNRTPGSGTDERISMQAGSPAPPEMCNGKENCECFQIGF